MVKIEEDHTSLKTNLIDRYKYLISKKYDEIFSLNEGVSEINFQIFNKIYDNYEFAINENEYLFYEHQLEEIRLKEKETNLNIIDSIGSTLNNNDNRSENNSSLNKINLLSNQNSITNNLTLNVNSNNVNIQIAGTNGGNVDCRKLSSKFFKKGTFIWICKKIEENVIENYLISSYKFFTKLFKDDEKKYLESLYNYTIDLFFKKLNDLIEKNKDFKEIDSIFLKEGLSCFYYPFCEALQKINCNKIIKNGIIAQKILTYNEKILNNYLKNFFLNYILDVAKLFSEVNLKIFNNINNFLKNDYNNLNNNLENNIEFNSNNSGNINVNLNQNINNLGNILFSGFYGNATSKIFLNNEITILINKLQNLINEKTYIIQKLDIQDILSLTEEDKNKIIYNNLISIYEIPFFVIKSFNLYKNDSLGLGIFYSSSLRSNLTKVEKENFESDLNIIKRKVKDILNLDKYINFSSSINEKDNSNNLIKIDIKKDYQFILLFLYVFSLKSMEDTKTLNEKFLKNFPEIKKSKEKRNRLTIHLENNIKDSLFSLYESFIQIYDNYIHKKLKFLFFDFDLHTYENAITFRLPLRDLLLELFHFKKMLLIILEEEAKRYNEKKLSTLNEALIHKKQRKLSKFQKEMECLSIRRLEIFNLNVNEEIYPQTIMTIIVKIFLKVNFIFLYYLIIFKFN